MYQVDGYIFESREEAKQAKKEADGIAYIREQTRMDNPEVVRKLYDKLLDQGIFETAVGFGFLRELQQYLRAVPYMEDKDIRPIPVPEKDGADVERARLKAREKARKRRLKEEKRSLEDKNFRSMLQVSLFINILCVAIIAGMFIITYVSGKSTTILNYKNRIIDEYEAWEQELDERESELEIREERLSAQQE